LYIALCSYLYSYCIGREYFRVTAKSTHADSDAARLSRSSSIPA
jgi:hypothetical protein